jgi:NodT family efflux transporter outer membrane factor (OMF) lipoprotein
MKNLHYKNTIRVVFCLYLLIQAGCTVGPDYKPQDVNAPPGWVGTQNTASPDAMLLKWWTEFNDANLTSLIERAMKSNLDLKQAEERIRQARATRGVAAAGFWPTADLTGSATRNHTPKARAVPASTANLFQAGLDAAWELDIFGGTRRNIESADAGILAAVEDRRDVLVTLTSEVANNYVQLRGYQQEIIIAQNNLKVQKHTAEVTRQQFQGGFVSALDVANADAQAATTMSQIPVFETSARQAIYNISVLLGQEPASLLEELSPASSIPFTPPEVPAGLPSEMLRRRPDIRRAEAQIHSATAQIGVATADLFPKFNLAGSTGISASRLSDMQLNKRSWSFGPSADWQIFNAGQVSANIDVQKSLQQQAVLTYKQTVLTALNDVESALVAYDNEHKRHKALVDAVTANLKAVELSTELYSEGQTDFLNVLVSQGSLNSSEDAFVQSTRNLSTDLIAIYKALGGGWDVNSPDSD